MNASDLGTTMRADGTEEVTYKGHPLYYFVADTSAGSTKGQGSDSFGAKWWLVAPSGTAITAGTSTVASTSGSSSGGGSLLVVLERRLGLTVPGAHVRWHKPR